jgi:hydroxymethylbilane synthase
MLPAAAQGVIGIECRSDRSELRGILRNLDHAATRTTTVAERAVAMQLQADCQSPVATYARITDASLSLEAMVASADGNTVIRERISGSVEEPESLGILLADKLLDMGAAPLLAGTGADE